MGTQSVIPSPLTVIPSVVEGSLHSLHSVEMTNHDGREISPCATLSRDDTTAEVKASSPIRTSLIEREGSMWGSLKRPSRRPTNIVDDCRSDDSALCHEMLTTFGFTQDQMHRAAERFHLGRSKSGKTIYWMIDDLGICHDGHLGDSWVSTMLKSRYPDCAPYITVEHCLFGLHQLIEENQAEPLMVPAYHSVRATGGAVASSPKGRPWRGDASLVPFLRAEEMNSLKPIGIVQSERSAVLLSELCPELLWLAYSYASNFTLDKFEPLQGRKVTLYPRADPNQEYYYSFLELADQVKRTYKNIAISVSSFLEDNATDDQKQRNIDLLEYMYEEN